MLADKGIPFDIKKNIASRWLRKNGEAKTSLHGKQLEFRFACFACLDLNARLFPDTVV